MEMAPDQIDDERYADQEYQGEGEEEYMGEGEEMMGEGEDEIYELDEEQYQKLLMQMQ